MRSLGVGVWSRRVVCSFVESVYSLLELVCVLSDNLVTCTGSADLLMQVIEAVNGAITFVF